MAAPIGNQYWKLAHNWVKPVKMKPEEILPKALEYIEWCEANPLIEEKAFGTGFIAKMNKLRAPTIQGFCFYCNMAPHTFYDYEKQEGYSHIITRVKTMFFSVKVEGAAAGLLDSNIIARETGLAEKVEQHNTGTTKTEITVTSKEAQKEVDDMIKKFDNE